MEHVGLNQINYNVLMVMTEHVMQCSSDGIFQQQFSPMGEELDISGFDTNTIHTSWFGYAPGIC